MANLESILFPVEIVDSVELTGISANSEYSKAVVGTIKGEKKLLNCCSDRYQLIPNSEIFLPIRSELMQAGIIFNESYSSVNDARFYGKMILEGHNFEVSPGDVIKPQINVRHSYNGLTKYAITFGYFRLVCSNGLVIPVKEKEHLNFNISGKHTTNIKHSIEMLHEAIQRFIGQSEMFINRFGELKDHSINNVEDRIIEVLNAAKITPVDNSKFNTVEYVKNVISQESNALYGSFKPNDWLIYNGINSYIFNDELNVKVPEVRETMDSEVLSFLMA